MQTIFNFIYIRLFHVLCGTMLNMKITDTVWKTFPEPSQKVGTVLTLWEPSEKSSTNVMGWLLCCPMKYRLSEHVKYQFVCTHGMFCLFHFSPLLYIFFLGIYHFIYTCFGPEEQNSLLLWTCQVGIVLVLAYIKKNIGRGCSNLEQNVRKFEFFQAWHFVFKVNN